MNANVQVLFEDNHLIAVNKPAGMLVQADETGDSTLADWVKHYIKVRYDKPGDVFLGTVHRIDRPVSGAVVFARTTKALTRMNALFQQREVEKTYWAITHERPQPLKGELTHYLLKDHQKNITHAYNKPRDAGAKEARLRYELLASLGHHHLVQVFPETGRPHQIRAQLAKMGWPIRGDVKYGAPEANPDGSIHLHARSLAFTHPVKLTPVRITAMPYLREQVWGMFREWV